jgi:hypothetical protein
VIRGTIKGLKGGQGRLSPLNPSTIQPFTSIVGLSSFTKE